MEKNNLDTTEEIQNTYQHTGIYNDCNNNYELASGDKKHFFIQTFGCQMNENDSERLAGMLNEMGYTETDKQEESDLIIYNTCCVRENAEFRVYGHLGALKKLKKENPDLIIAVCGCMMQQKDVVEQIRKKYRHVDLIFGTYNLHTFPELLHGVIESKSVVADIWDEPAKVLNDAYDSAMNNAHDSAVNNAYEKAMNNVHEKAINNPHKTRNRSGFEGNMPIKRKDKVRAFVTIMHGCNNFCSYCIVPYVRGRERSREIPDILNEVKLLSEQNFKEITLLGQNVNSYGKDLPVPATFAELLRELDKIEGISRIRFMTSHPRDLSNELILAMKECGKVSPHLHLPVQSGSSRVLKEMNRGYTKEYYIDLIRKIRENIPHIALTTDIIVGFPGETEEDFEETINLIEKIRFDFAFTFLYSKRKGTPAAQKAEQIDEETKKRRFARLVEIQNKISKEINDELLGEKLEILVEGLSKNSISTYAGRTLSNKIVNFKADKDLTGRLVNVKIRKVKTWSLEGNLED